MDGFPVNQRNHTMRYCLVKFDSEKLTLGNGFRKRSTLVPDTHCYLMAFSHYTGTGPEQVKGTGSGAMGPETGKGTWIHYFLLCWPSSLFLSQSCSHAM